MFIARYILRQLFEEERVSFKIIGDIFGLGISKRFLWFVVIWDLE